LGCPLRITAIAKLAEHDGMPVHEQSHHSYQVHVTIEVRIYQLLFVYECLISVFKGQHNHIHGSIADVAYAESRKVRHADVLAAMPILARTKADKKEIRDWIHELTSITTPITYSVSSISFRRYTSDHG
jgi:hypothetical protein